MRYARVEKAPTSFLVVHRADDAGGGLPPTASPRKSGSHGMWVRAILLKKDKHNAAELIGYDRSIALAKVLSGQSTSRQVSAGVWESGVAGRCVGCADACPVFCADHAAVMATAVDCMRTVFCTVEDTLQSRNRLLQKTCCAVDADIDFLWVCWDVDLFLC